MILWLKTVADMLLPRTCLVCGRKLMSDEEHLCRDCHDDIPLTRFHLLRHNPMADRFNEAIQTYLESVWDQGPQPFERYAYATALFFYDGGGEYRHITHQIKYHGNISVGRHFGGMLGLEVARTPWMNDVDAIIPVPLHWRRRLSRGYNQAEIIAEAVSSVTGAPVRTDILKRTRHTRTQTRLDISAKASNVKGAFSARLPHPSDLRHILLVDDVFTTGSTLMACFTALRTVFPPTVRISVATLGFVGGG